MYCPNCGQEVKDGIKFCPYCGCELVEDEKDNTNKPSKAFNVFYIIGRILSIFSIASCWIPLCSLFTFIPGIVFSALGKKTKNEVKMKRCKKQIGMCIASAIICFIITFAFFLLIVLGILEGIEVIVS